MRARAARKRSLVSPCARTVRSGEASSFSGTSMAMSAPDRPHDDGRSASLNASRSAGDAALDTSLACHKRTRRGPPDARLRVLQRRRQRQRPTPRMRICPSVSAASIRSEVSRCGAVSSSDRRASADRHGHRQEPGRERGSPRRRARERCALATPYTPHHTRRTGASHATGGLTTANAWPATHPFTFASSKSRGQLAAAEKSDRGRRGCRTSNRALFRHSAAVP